jgi:hypothetical protein
MHASVQCAFSNGRARTFFSFLGTPKSFCLLSNFIYIYIMKFTIDCLVATASTAYTGASRTTSK